jgi:hypothetical protein
MKKTLLLLFTQPLIYPMNPNMMQPPPHNGMMNMQQQLGPQYINQQVKNYYIVFMFFKMNNKKKQFFLSYRVEFHTEEKMARKSAENCLQLDIMMLIFNETFSFFHPP